MSGKGATETWKHMCRELIRDAAPNWIRKTPKGEACSECGKYEEEVEAHV